jgi:cyanate permease
MLAVIGGTEARHAGRASAMIQFGFLSGLAWGPAAFGLLVDATGSYSTGWLGVTLLLAAGALVTTTERRAGPVRHEGALGQPRR